MERDEIVKMAREAGWPITDGSALIESLGALIDAATEKANERANAREHTAKASPSAKTIKLADLIDNTRSIVARDPKFAEVYLAEKRLLLEVLREGDPALYAEAARIAGV